MKITTIQAEHLYVHPVNQFANQSLVQLIGPDIVNREYHHRPVLGGGTKQVIEVSRDEMVIILENEGPMNLKYKKYFEFTGQELLRPAEFSANIRSHSFRELLDRQIRKHLESFRLALNPSRAERNISHTAKQVQVKTNAPSKKKVSRKIERVLVFNYD